MTQTIQTCCRRVSSSVQTKTFTKEKEKTLALRFNASKLVDDCGGVHKVAEALGKTRTAPYRMMRTGYMGTPALGQLLEVFPNINLNDYFENDDGHTQERTG